MLLGGEERGRTEPRTNGPLVQGPSEDTCHSLHGDSEPGQGAPTQTDREY